MEIDSNTPLPPTFKAELEKIASESTNQYCFDCNNQPALWASVNNGIFLCFNCSSDHKGFGAGNSYIKSSSMDQWNAMQLKLMRTGGNRRLRKFLNMNEIPPDLDKKDAYLSRAMKYYRRMLRAEAEGEEFNEIPPRNDLRWTLDHSEAILFHKPPPKPEPYKFNDNSRHMDNEYVPYSPYAQNGFVTLSTSSDEYINNDSESYGNSNSYYYYATNIIGTIWTKSKSAAWYLRSSLDAYPIGRKITYVGDKAAEMIWYTGGVVLEKTGQVIRSDTVSAIASKAGDSLLYLKNKIISTPTAGGNGIGNTEDYFELGTGSSIEQCLLNENS